MEYHEAVGSLKSLQRLRPEPGTETTASLLDHLGGGYETLTAVQVAGSNGKGSTTRMLARILREAGLSVGLYTSPDLNDLRERIRVRGQKIPRTAVVQFVETAWPHIVDRTADDEGPTFFEAFTALALWYFDREDVDVAVLEVGIGGRYDATSVVDPVAAAVTSVSLEHTGIIGETVEEIARDQAQIAPADSPLVTGASGAALETIRETTDVVTVGAGEDATVRASETPIHSATESELELEGPDWTVETYTPLLGEHQAVNAGVAATLAHQVAHVPERDIARGIRNVHWPGRFEVLDREPLTVLDSAHNPAACRTLASLLDRFDYEDLHLVFGAMSDKDHRGMISALPGIDRVYLAEPDVERAQNMDTLAAVFDREHAAPVEEVGPTLAAVTRALSNADHGDCVLVAGSLYTIGEARDRWTRTPTPSRTDTAERARSVMRNADVPAVERERHDESLVSRTVGLYIRPGQAADLRERMAAIGGTCAVSGISGAHQHLRAVLSGTLTQYEQLLDGLAAQEGTVHLAHQLETVLRDRAVPPDDYPWQETPAVMGILNVTPDSFHDGGQYEALEDAVEQGRTMAEAGAAIVDVGGESTRPGGEPVPVEEEKGRVLPVVERLSAALDVPVSIDTRKPEVAEAAIEAGADIVNDVTGLQDAAMRRVVASAGVPAVLMHSLSAPVDPDWHYEYDDVVDAVIDTLGERILLAERAGIDRSQLIVDPGVGFGKRPSESYRVLDRLEELRSFGCPVMVGHSHKSMFESVAGEDRLAPTVAATALAVERGADIVRVHDVEPNVAAVRTAERTVREVNSTAPTRETE